jgi:nicotinamidase-related amidase
VHWFVRGICGGCQAERYADLSLGMDALLVVDIQNDFLPGGALAVANGDQVIPVINRLMESFALVLATQDWHPAQKCARRGSQSSNPAICKRPVFVRD